MGQSAKPSYVEPEQDDSVVDTVATVPSTETRLGGLEDLTKNILVIIVVSVGAMIVALVVGVSALILDQLHFNNQIYRDGYNPPVQTKYVTQTEIKPVILKPPKQ